MNRSVSVPLQRQGGPVAWTSHSIIQWQRDLVEAAGGDPSIVPDTPFRLLRIAEVKQLTGLSRSSLYRLISEKRFPASIPLCASVSRQVGV